MTRLHDDITVITDDYYSSAVSWEMALTVGNSPKTARVTGRQFICQLRYHIRPPFQLYMKVCVCVRWLEGWTKLPPTSIWSRHILYSRSKNHPPRFPGISAFHSRILPTTSPWESIHTKLCTNQLSSQEITRDYYRLLGIPRDYYWRSQEITIDYLRFLETTGDY